MNSNHRQRQPQRSDSSNSGGCNRCSCCPYGYHIDVDFVHYCEALVTALSNSSRPSYQSQSFRDTRSLPRRNRLPSSSSSTFSSPSLPATDAFLYLCDWNPKNGVNGKVMSKPPPKPAMRPHYSAVHGYHLSPTHGIDSSLNEVVAEFEEVLREQQHNSLRSRRKFSEDVFLNSSDLGNLHIESPPASPAPSLASSVHSNVNKAVLTNIRDQMAIGLQKMKELEEQLKVVPILRQKLLILREEKKKLQQKLNGKYDKQGFGLLDEEEMLRIKDLENSGVITPTMNRRRVVWGTDGESDEETAEDIWMRKSPPPSNLVSSKNIRLDQLGGDCDDGARLESESRPTPAPAPAPVPLRLSVSSSTNTDSEWSPLKPLAVDATTNTQSPAKTSQNRFSFDVLDSVSIQPDSPPKVASKRSIGISTSFAPSLPRPRKNASSGTDLKLRDTVSLRELNEKKPILTSTGTDPIRINTRDNSCQAVVKKTNTGTRTDTVPRRDAAILCNYNKDFNIRPNTRSVQTESKSFYDKSVQVSERCSICELKQTETIGVGDHCINTVDIGVDTDRMAADTSSPVSRASSQQSIRLCDKCNDAITCAAKEVVKDKTPSPTASSKIPRLAFPSVDARTDTSKIIIEESVNEILVYRNPGAGSSKHRANLPKMISPNLGQLEEVCKIESESESDDSQDSSEEGTYEVETSTVSRSVTRKRVEPSKEMKAALKVLNDSLLQPKRANKSATAKSVQIIEREWFKVAAQKSSDSTAIEDYLDSFETFSKHLLNQVVNLADSNGNTAMHYAISHSNFDAASVLLDSKVCDVNKQNKAGYTAVMLVSLAKVSNDTQRAVIRRLFQLGDVNIRAIQNGQTALMLAASHGQFVTCKLLIEAGSDINVQDNDGSTAIMCAAEHGQLDVVRLLLSHPDCDPSITDNDGSCALSIAMEGGHKDIGLMLYASSNMLSRGSSPYASLRRSQSKAIASSLRRTGSFSSRSQVTNKTFTLATSPPSRSRHSSASSQNKVHKK